jgi:hypothetical protein
MEIIEDTSMSPAENRYTTGNLELTSLALPINARDTTIDVLDPAGLETCG